MKILAIDGGGIRGYVPAHILARIEEITGKRAVDHFDMVAGTSTGAIVAAAVALGIPASEVSRLYKEEGPNIFARYRAKGRLAAVTKMLSAITSSLYQIAPLERALNGMFEGRRMGDARVPLLIPAVSVADHAPMVLKSSSNQQLVRDPQMPIVDAVLGSCSAPIYFTPHTTETNVIVDGGLWANNPSLVALIEAVHCYELAPGETHILSLGTGQFRNPAGYQEGGNLSGLLSWWLRLVNLPFDVSSIAVDNMAKQLGAHVLRLNPQLPKAIALDDAMMLPELQSVADSVLTNNWPRIDKFLEEAP